MSLRPYISWLPDRMVRSREHGGRPFPGKRRLRRTLKKSARQLRRLAIIEELRP